MGHRERGRGCVLIWLKKWVEPLASVSSAAYCVSPTGEGPELPFLNLTREERRHALKLAAVVGSRMFGLFLVMPVLVVLAQDMPGYTPVLAGLAIGVYGLTQAGLQQPFGRWSDRWGRRPVLVAGLLLFVLGSVIAALSEHVGFLILGRALQGCGAVAGVTLSFVADQTQASRRSSAMALIGMAIGAAFLVSVVAAAPLAAWLGLSGLFWLTALLGLLSVALVLGMPRELPVRAESLHSEAPPSGMVALCVSVFLIHALMTSLFVVLPVMLIGQHGLELARHWTVYLPAMLLSAGLVFPLLKRLPAGTDAWRWIPWTVALLGLSLVILAAGLPLAGLIAGCTAFFLAFNLLEAGMPALLSVQGGGSGRGARMGVYTTWQFLGAFAGGIAAGALSQWASPQQGLMLLAVLCLLWAGLMRQVQRAGRAGLERS